MRVEVLGPAAVTIGVIALTESFHLLPAALTAYAAAWGVLQLERLTAHDRVPHEREDR